MPVVGVVATIVQEAIIVSFIVPHSRKGTVEK
jgi:hypothetical protein